MVGCLNAKEEKEQNRQFIEEWMINIFSVEETELSLFNIVWTK